MSLSRLRGLLHVRFVRNVLTFQLSTIITLVTGLLSSVIYARLLGLEQYGLYAVVSAFAGLLTIVAGWGQDTTVATFLAESVGKKDPALVRSVLRYFAQSTFLGTVIHVALIIAAPLLAGLIQNDPTIGEYARLAIVNTMLQPLFTLVIIMLQLRQRIPLITALENSRSILQLGLATLLLVMGFGVWGIFLGTSVISLLYIPVCIHLYRVHARALGFPSLLSLFRDLRGADTTPYFRQGFWIALDRHIARNLYPNAFFLVLGRVAPLETVGLFRLALRLASLPAELVMPSISRLSAISLPRLAGENIKELRSSCIKLIKGTLGLMLTAVIGASICVPLFLPYVYGREFMGAIPVFFTILPFNLISGLNVASIPLARVFRKVHVLIGVNLLGLCGALLVFAILRTILPDAHAMGFGLLYYHINSLLLYAIMWRSIRATEGPRSSHA